jgi:hypothetical protein
MTSPTRPHTVVVIRPTEIHSTASRRSQLLFRKRCLDTRRRLGTLRACMEVRCG